MGVVVTTNRFHVRQHLFRGRSLRAALLEALSRRVTAEKTAIFLEVAFRDVTIPHRTHDLLRGFRQNRSARGRRVPKQAALLTRLMGLRVSEALS